MKYDNLYSVLNHAFEMYELYRDYIREQIITTPDFNYKDSILFEQYKEARSVAWSVFECYIKMGFMDDDKIYNDYFSRLLKGGIYK